MQSAPATITPGASACWTFFGFYESDHPAASTDDDLKAINIVKRAAQAVDAARSRLVSPNPQLAADARPAVADVLGDKAIGERYRRRLHVERSDGEVLSFFSPGKTHNRHVVLRDKERVVARRHGALLRSGDEMLPD